MTKVIDENNDDTILNYIKNDGDKQKWLYTQYINMCNSNNIPIKKTLEIFTLQYENFLDNLKNDGEKHKDLYPDYINMCNSNKIPIIYKTSKKFSLKFQNFLDNEKISENSGLYNNKVNIFTLGILCLILIGYLS